MTIKSCGFPKRKEWEPARPRDERPFSPSTVKPLHRGTYGPVASPLVPVSIEVREVIEPGELAVPKEAPVRSEAYRRLVASFPCINCGLWGYSQFAHSNVGKGMAIKVSDLEGFPLCTVHPGSDGFSVEGCHEGLDRGTLFTKAVRREIEPVWARDTRRRVIAMKKWPLGLPYYEGDEA